MFYAGKDLDEVCKIISRELNILHIWFQVNKLSLNVAKTNFMIFGNKRFEENYMISINGMKWYDLTRFNKINKIAIQGTPQMAVDKEALICLSRVYSYYFKCNFPLFYVYPALTRYLSILFLNILTLLACTHSSDNLFHTLMVLCENENFLTSNLLCFFTRVKLCPLVILLSLIWKKKVIESIFS